MFNFLQNLGSGIKNFYNTYGLGAFKQNPFPSISNMPISQNPLNTPVASPNIPTITQQTQQQNVVQNQPKVASFQNSLTPTALSQTQLPQNALPANTNPSSASSGLPTNPADIFKALADPNLRSALGIGLTPEAQATTQRLIALQDQLAKANAPDPVIQQLNSLINQNQLQTANLTPIQYLKDNPSLQQGMITEGQLGRTVEQQKLPLEQALANLLVGRSAASQQYEINRQSLNAQAASLANTANLQNQLRTGLPPEVGQKYLENILVPQITPHFETILNAQGQPERVNIQTNQLGQVVGQELVGKTYVAPNMFNFLQQNPVAANALNTAINQGLLNPGAVNSRNAAFLAQLYQSNPNINTIQLNAAAKFWESSATQEKLAWSKSVNTNLTLLEGLSNQIPRTEFPLVNKAIIASKTYTGSPQAVQFVNAANRTAAELARVLGDSGGSDFRTKLAGALLDPNYSPQQFSAAIQTERQMIGSLQQAFSQQGGQSNLPGTANTNDPMGIR